MLVRVAIFTALLATTLSFALPGLARAQGEGATDQVRQQARVQFTRGVALYETDDFRGALVAFQEAYRLAPHPTVRVNMANCYEHLNSPLLALNHFELFLREAADAPRDQRREVRRAITRLSQHVGGLEVAVSPDGALLTIDGRETRRTPITDPIRLVAGTHEIQIQLEGYRSERREVQVPGGGSTRLALRLERGQDPTPPVAVAPPVSEEPRMVEAPTTSEPPAAVATSDQNESDAPSSAQAQEPSYDEPAAEGGPLLTTPVLIAGISTLTLGVGTAIFGGLALGANDSFESAVAISNDPDRSLGDQLQARSDGFDAADQANTFSLVTDVLLVGTLIGAGATSVLFILGGDSEDEPSPVALLPLVGPNVGGLSAQGQF